MSVSVSSCSASTDLSASMIRESSPPLATCESGFFSCPAFNEIKNRTWSIPFADKCVSLCSTSIAKSTYGKFRERSACFISFSSFAASLHLILDAFWHSASSFSFCCTSSSCSFILYCSKSSYLCRKSCCFCAYAKISEMVLPYFVLHLLIVSRRSFVSVYVCASNSMLSI